MSLGSTLMGEIMTYTGGKKYLQGSPMPFRTQVGDVVGCFWGRRNYILRTSGDKGSSTAIRQRKRVSRRLEETSEIQEWI